MECLIRLSRRLLGKKKEPINTGLLPAQDVLVEKARQEWQAAQFLFNNVIEKNLIDHAIFKMNAAERRYIFLLQETRSLRTDMQEQILKGGIPDRGM